MDSERWARIEEIFDTALALDGRERERFLASACSGDSTLLAEIRSLLEAAAGADAFLRGVAGRAGLSLSQETTHPGEADVRGLRFGPYRATRLLGRGGMGAVYVGERDDDQFRMAVAIKTIPRPELSPEVRARFLSERQILARLHHRNVAQLLDGGVSDDGVPYLVMELVEGRPIDAYAREEGLGVEERLQLFLQVCRGVQHAHGNLIVHRDLKPANILVTADGTVKLLDFGIARLLESDEALYRTAVHASHPMTLAYASPEQIRGEPATTACDVYGLGVLLYRLLAGRHPYDFAPGSSFPQAQKVISEVTPPAPGRVGDRDLSPDLDAVTLKAMAKEPERRYASVAELSRDLERYLSGLPVTARPPTPGYRMRRFVGRHRGAVAAGTALAALVFALLGLGVRYAVDTRRSEAELALEVETTRAVSDFLVGLFAAADPTQGGSDTLSAGTLLARGVARAGTELESAPLVRARILTTLADVYWRLGYARLADSLGFEGLVIRREVQGADHPETVRDALTLADRNRIARNPLTLPRSEELYRDVLGLVRDAPDRRRELAFAESGLGRLFLLKEERDSALTYLRASVRHGAEDMEPGDSSFLRLKEGLAAGYRDAELPDSAIALYEELLAAAAALGPEGDGTVAAWLNNLGYLLRVQGRYAEAEARYRRALEEYEHARGRGDTMTLLSNLAQVLQLQGKVEAMERVLRDRLDYARQHWPEDHWRVGSGYAVLGRGLLMADHPTRAESELRKGVAVYEAALGPGHRWTAELRGTLAEALEEQGRHAEAEVEIQAALGALRATTGPDPSAVRRLEDQLAKLKERIGRGAPGG